MPPADPAAPQVPVPDAPPAGSSSNLPSTPSDAPPALCDCERGYNGLGMAVRECDCQSKPATEPADDYQVADALEATNGLHDACITRVQAGGIRALVARIAADAARIRELEARQVPDGWQVVPTTFLRTFDEGERLSPHYLAAAVEAAARAESNMTPPSC